MQAVIRGWGDFLSFNDDTESFFSSEHNDMAFTEGH